MRYGLTVSADSPPADSPPFEVISLAAAKRHLRIDHDEDDEYLTSLIPGVVEQAEKFCNAAFSPKIYTLTLPEFPGIDGYRAGYLPWPTVYPSRTTYRREIYLPRHPLLEVLSLEYVDTAGDPQTMAAEDYIVSASRLPPQIVPLPGVAWPATQPDHPEAVQVTFRAGFEVCPAGALIGIKLWLGHLYENRENTIAGVSISEIPAGAEHWLTSYRMWPLT